MVEGSIPEDVVMFYYREYAERTLANRNQVKALCEEKSILLKQHKLTFSNPVESWKMLYETITELPVIGKEVVVDITTMPRETIWTVFDLLVDREAPIEYVYHKPAEYNKEWLSRDPGKPRLVYKLGGLAKLGVPTRLVVLSGYDLDRVKQLIAFFEPEVTLLGVQIGSQFDNIALNIKKHYKEFETRPEVKIFDVDAYSEDHGYEVIQKQIDDQVGSSNVLMSSLGPKLSAVALYRLHRTYPETGLVYAPSMEFNPEYSDGIGETLVRKLAVVKLVEVEDL
jgi:hypothetical protein